MLTALILICSIAVTPDVTNCAVKNAAVVMRVPGAFGHPAACLMRAQAFFWLRLPLDTTWELTTGLESSVAQSKWPMKASTGERGVGRIMLM